MRRVTILLFATCSISAIAIYANFKNNAAHHNKNMLSKHAQMDMRNALVRMKQYSSDAKAYAIKNNLNNRYCFLIDMKISSGSKRFFIYDFKNDSILQSGLVTHRSGFNNLTDSIIFSNAPGSNCSSLGKYKTGKPYYGKFGLAWKLYGLDKTNSNAFDRFEVLHSHPCVPDHEIAPRQICESWGCPTVSPLFLNQLKLYLDNSPKPILLWIYN